jgi:hypothetical protein
MEDINSVAFIAPGPLRARKRARMTRLDRFLESVYYRLAMSYWRPIRPLSLFACRRAGALDAKYWQSGEHVHVRLYNHNP